MMSLIGLMLLGKVLSDPLHAFENRRRQAAADDSISIRLPAATEHQIGL